MQKINFKNLPDTSTPLNASTLNQMQDNIEEAIENIEPSGGGGESDKVGVIKLFSGATAPDNWLICDGSAISRTEYAELFSTIGTTYGEGDGSTTFNLPNLKGRVAVGLDSNDTDFDTLGETGGSKYLQEHTHKYNISTSGATGSNGTRLTVWNGTGSTYDNASGAMANTGTGNSGNLQPYIVLNYIIKASATTTTQGQIIDSLSGDSTTDAPSVHAVNEKFTNLSETVLNLRGTVLWINENADTSFAAQDININNLANYDMLEIIYRASRYNRFSKTTKFINATDQGTVLDWLDTAASATWYRNATIRTNKIEISVCTNNSTSSTNTSDCIPLYVIGYKTGLFN